MRESSISPLKLVSTAIWLFAWAGSILVLGGDARWIQGWIFAAWFIVMCFGVTAWVYVHDPALLAERYRAPGTGGQKGWDFFAVIAIVILFIAWMALSPLDARRFGWSPRFPIAIQIIGGILLAPSFYLFFGTFRDNSFASGLVRIQSERKQRVITTGVYAFVRHPMYLAAVLMFVGGALLLGSVVGVALSIAMTLVLGVRIIGEEKMLATELEGYDAYRDKVRSRLIPFIW